MPFTIIIPSRNPDNLFPCLEAIYQHEESPQIIVVDDGLAMRPLADGLRYVPGVKPFVYARNINEGIKACSGDVLLLNDDAILQTPGGFSVLSSAATDNHEYGIIASTCNNVGNRAQRPKDVGLRSDPRMVCFVCVYIPRRTVDIVGMLDERFVGYGFDDDDYCLRIRQAGLKIGIHDGCYADHGSLKSSYRGEPKTPANLSHNQAIFVAKWGSHPL